VALVAGTVLVGQAVLGWHNDIVDRTRDHAHRRAGKPIADGRLDPGTAWFAWCCGVLLLVPLAVNNGVLAGCCYLASVAVGLLGNLDNHLVRRGLLSWLPWAVSFSLYPAFLSYGGWGGQAEGDPPQPALVVLAALLGIGVHFLTALWGLVSDDEDGWTYLPLRFGRRVGATLLLVLTLVYLAVVAGAFAVVAYQLGLSR
jgi:4-hydroxybenzoate polyprenyltransferase